MARQEHQQKYSRCSDGNTKGGRDRQRVARQVRSAEGKGIGREWLVGQGVSWAGDDGEEGRKQRKPGPLSLLSRSG